MLLRHGLGEALALDLGRAARGDSDREPAVRQPVRMDLFPATAGGPGKVRATDNPGVARAGDHDPHLLAGHPGHLDHRAKQALRLVVGRGGGAVGEQGSEREDSTNELLHYHFLLWGQTLLLRRFPRSTSTVV